MGGTVLDNPARAIYRNGKSEGKIEAYISLLKDGIISMAEATKRLNMTEDSIKSYM